MGIEKLLEEYEERKEGIESEMDPDRWYAEEQQRLGVEHDFIEEFISKLKEVIDGVL